MPLRSILFSILIGISLGGVSAAKAADPATATREPNSSLLWYDAGQLTIEGVGFSDTETSFTRLPAKSLDEVSKSVRWLSSDSAGVCVRFESDSTSLSAVWATNKVDGMRHMARTGSNGLDLYRREPNGGWKYVATGRPDTTRTLALLDKNLSGTLSEYLLYLPLYSKTEELKIGVAEGATLRAAEPRSQGDLPIVFYGTSITQGGCASRAGMCHVAILGRWLNKETINLGFSGSGKGEIEMARLVASIPASAYVVESLPNMNSELVRKNYRPFVRTLREKNPETPIIIVQNPLFPNDSPDNTEVRNIYMEMQKSGDKNVHFLFAEAQLAGRENGTVDGVHPTDLGFFWMAESYEPLLRQVLGIANRSKGANRYRYSGEGKLR